MNSSRGQAAVGGRRAMRCQCVGGEEAAARLGRHLPYELHPAPGATIRARPAAPAGVPSTMPITDWDSMMMTRMIMLQVKERESLAYY